MITELQLKFKSDTGTSATRMIYSKYDEDSQPTILPDNETEMEIPTDEYLEWLEDLATKQLASEKKLKVIEADFGDIWTIVHNITPDSDWSDIEELKELSDLMLRNL